MTDIRELVIGFSNIFSEKNTSYNRNTRDKNSRRKAAASRVSLKIKRGYRLKVGASLVF